MSFNWAAADPRFKQDQPWRYETFRGYFTDIQRAARRTLPRRPNKELSSLLGLTLSPTQLMPRATSDVTRRPSGSEEPQTPTVSIAQLTAPKELVPVIRTANRPPDLPRGRGKSKVRFVKDAVLCRTDADDRCTSREKTVYAVACYFAIVIFLLLVIVVILASTLSALAADNGDGNVSNLNTNSDGTRPDSTTKYPNPGTVKPDGSTTTSVLTTTRPSFISTTKTADTTTLQRNNTTTAPEPSGNFTETTADLNQSTTSTTLGLFSTEPSSTLSLEKSTSLNVHNNSTTDNHISTTHAVNATSSKQKNTTTDATNIFTSTDPTNVTNSPTTTENPSTSINSSTDVTDTPRTNSTSNVTQSTLSSTEPSRQSPTITTTPIGVSTTVNSTLTSKPEVTTQEVENTEEPNGTTDDLTTKQTIPQTTVIPTTNRTGVTATPVTNTAQISDSTTAPPPTSVDPSSFPKLPAPVVEPTCSTSTCERARETINRLDFSVSPCVDFYDLSCGKWARDRSNEIFLQNKKNVPRTVQEELQQKLKLQLKDILSVPNQPEDGFGAKVTKRLYQYCTESNMNGNAVLVLIELQSYMNLLSLTPTGTITRTLPSLLQVASSRFQVSPFFSLAYETLPLADDTLTYGVQLAPPKLYLDTDIYLRPLDTSESALMYVNAVAQVLYTFLSSVGIEENFRRKRQAAESVDFRGAYSMAARVYNFETSIAQIISDNTISPENALPVSNTYTLSDLKTKYPNIPWTSILDTSLDTILVELVEESYFESLNAFINPEIEEDAKLYTFVTIAVQRIWGYMPYTFRSYFRDVGNNQDYKYTEIDCIDLVLRLAAEEAHSVYITEYTKNVLDRRLQITNIESTMNDAFRRLVTNAKWIQSDLAKLVVSRAQNLNLYFSPLKAILRQTSGISDVSQSLLSLCLELHRQNHEYHVGRLGASKVTTVEMSWMSTEFHYSDALQTLGIPTGLVVYLANGDPDFHLYGYTGILLAKELIKILTGPLAGGLPPQWWGTSNVLNFENITQCFTDQLSRLQTVNDDVGNVLLHNGAYQLAIKSHSSASSTEVHVIPGTSVSENMMFMFNTAQLFCQLDDNSVRYQLMKQRVNNMLMNNSQFGCKNAAPMVPSQRCQIF